MDKKHPPALLKEIGSKDLIDLFKHWDSRVSHQETMYVTISVAPIGIAIGTNTVFTGFHLFILAIASITAYLFYIFLVRRFGRFQDNIFKMLEASHFSNWHEVINTSSGSLRKLRYIGLFVLALLWAALIYEKTYPSPVWSALIVSLLVVSAIFTCYLLLDHEEYISGKESKK